MAAVTSYANALFIFQLVKQFFQKAVDKVRLDETPQEKK